MSGQLDYAMFLPAISFGYGEAAIAPASQFRPMPAGLVPKDLNFLDPDSRLFYLPAALYSAGMVNNIANPASTMITNRDKVTSHVLGDSGGFQIISGGMSANTTTERLDIYKWQSANCDHGMTLDVPTKAIGHPKSHYKFFEECLKDTLAHLNDYERFYKSGNFTLLNVLQGRNEKEFDIWYEAVKSYDFDGWAIAGPLRHDWYQIVRRMLILIDEDMLGGKRFWVHFLGIGKLSTAALLTILRDGIRRKLNDVGIHASLDASNPSLVAGKFKTTYSGHSLTSKSMIVTKGQPLPINNPKYLGSSQPFPYPSSPIGAVLTLGDLVIKGGTHAYNRWDTLSSLMLMNHNIYVFLNAIYEANIELAKPRHANLTTIPTNIYSAKCVIEDVFDATDPWAELQKQKVYLDRV